MPKSSTALPDCRSSCRDVADGTSAEASDLVAAAEAGSFRVVTSQPPPVVALCRTRFEIRFRFGGGCNRLTGHSKKKRQQHSRTHSQALHLLSPHVIAATLDPARDGVTLRSRLTPQKKGGPKPALQRSCAERQNAIEKPPNM
jgi:hypothetical protein